MTSENKKEEAAVEAVEKSTKNQKSLFKKIMSKIGHFFKIVFSSFGGMILSLFVLGVFLAFSIYHSYADSFERAKKKNNSTQLVFYDKNGGIIYESFGAKTPKEVKLSAVPEVVKQATLAAEDMHFYQHGAIDIRGIARAALLNVRDSEKPGLLKIYDLLNEESYTQGGSTITQQLVKNQYLTTERSFERKIKELVYSIELEKKISKDSVFEQYLNNVYYGEQSLGISNAAQNYFGKDISDLNLAEATMLAGLPQAPTRLSPISGDFEASKKRQEYVLSKMVENNIISFEEAKEAANEPLNFSNKEAELVLKYPYFVDFVKKELAQKIGEEAMDRGGFEIYTSLDPAKQESAEKNINEYLKKFKYRKVTNAATVILDNKEGVVAALVGGGNWEESKVNVATSLRQPGSSFKPIVYLAGLLDGYTAGSLLADKYVNFGGTPKYVPRNYDGSYHGNVTIRTALQNSLNIPAVEMTKLVGVKKVAETAEKLGITSLKEDPTDYGLTIGLGSAEVKLFELARAYSVLANNGKYSNYTGIEKIIDSEGSEIYKRQKSFSQAIDEKVAYIMTNILSDNKARSMVFGTNSPLYIKNRPVAAKTGTTDDYADSWTVGYTPQYTVGVWMGNNDRTKMARISGVEGAAYIWQDIMKDIHLGLPALEFEKPKRLTELWINPKTGLPATRNAAPNQLELFIPGTEPTKETKFDYLKIFKK